MKPTPWWPRFWAWLIDVIILGIVGWIIFPAFAFDWWHVGANGVLALVYWSVLESEGRQSIGKKALNIKLVAVKGKNATLGAAAASAFGKAFLLPLDMIIGVLARPGKKQRLFNIASDTVVVEKR
ncbi:MAG: RDD family protein [Candidatus Aenigmarchaeota archaeon]|nr:RDD family protein [Candidatus Aenigmarchaeota archaeon]